MLYPSEPALRSISDEAERSNVQQGMSKDEVLVTSNFDILCWIFDIQTIRFRQSTKTIPARPLPTPQEAL
jgi:hypothetical protein